MTTPTPMQPPARVTVYSCLLALAWTFTAVGCSRNAAEVKPAAEKSTTETLVDGFTGRTAVQAGTKAREAISSVNTARESDIKELDTF